MMEGKEEERKEKETRKALREGRPPPRQLSP